ncbi:MAG: tetratricopeptide repeat protein [Bryobacteraceae bacterium]
MGPAIAMLALFLAGTSFDELSKQAATARDQNRLEEAARLYRQALRLKPDWSQGWWFLGTLRYDQDRYEEAAQAFTELITLKGDMGPGEALLGLCEFNLKRYDAALRHLIHAQKTGFGPDPQLTQVAIYHTALLLILAQNYERAGEQLTLLARTATPNDKVVLAAGAAALRRPVLPDDVPAGDRDLLEKVGRASIAEMQRQPSEAGPAYETALTAYPKAPGIHYAYGSFLLGADPDRALTVLKQEIEISPRHVPARCAIAGEYLKRGEAVSARPFAEEAARIAPQDFAARTAYGRALIELGDVTGAISELEAAVNLAPDSPHARFALAAAYRRAGRNSDADRERKEFARLQKLIDSEKK